MISLCFLHMIGLKGIWRMWWSRRGRCKRRKCYWTDEAFGKMPCFVAWSKTKLFYLTPQIRNDFLHDVSKEVIALIKIEAEATKFYAIIADKTMNISKMNQFSLTAYLLYVQDSSDSVERFVCCKSRSLFINKHTRWTMEHASAVTAKTNASSLIRLIKNHSKVLKLLQFETF